MYRSSKQIRNWTEIYSTLTSARLLQGRRAAVFCAACRQHVQIFVAQGSPCPRATHECFAVNMNVSTYDWINELLYDTATSAE